MCQAAPQVSVSALVIQVQVHGESDKNRVFRFPGLGINAEQVVLKRICVEAIEPGVDSGRVTLQ